MSIQHVKNPDRSLLRPIGEHDGAMTDPDLWPRTSRAKLIWWGVAGALVVVVLVVSLMEKDSTQKSAIVAAQTPTSTEQIIPAYEPPPAPSGHTVTYTIIGQAASSISYSTSGFGIEQAVGVPLPWEKTLTFEGDTVIASLNAQNSVAGKIECTIDIDGVTVADHTSTGEFAIVQCTASN